MSKDTGGPMKLTTWSHQKYADQPIALVSSEAGGLNLKLFDAVELFMTEPTWLNRKAVFDSGKAKEFAEQFVAQFNAGVKP